MVNLANICQYTVHIWQTQSFHLALSFCECSNFHSLLALFLFSTTSWVKYLALWRLNGPLYSPASCLLFLLKNGCLMWQETRLMRVELWKQNNELKKWIRAALKTDVSVPVENEVSEGMSDVRVWRLGYLKKQPGRLLETDGCEGSEVKFRKCTITALFWVTRHGHSGILCLCLQGISVASALMCIWESKGDCVVRGEGVGTWPQLHDLWMQSSSSAAQTCRSRVFLSRSDSWNTFCRSFHPTFSSSKHCACEL